MKRPSRFPGFMVPSDAGTTLLELLVVLAILGLLAAIAAPQMLRYFERGQLNAAETEIATLSASLNLFQADVGRYPSTAEGLSALVKQPADLENWSGPYIKNASSLRDPWGRIFVYHSTGEGNSFELFSLGPVQRVASRNRPP